MFHWDASRREELIQLFSVSGFHYLFLMMCEWHQPDEIRSFAFPDYMKPVQPFSEFVPFAHDGCGNEWCFWTTKATGRGVPVVLCVHDSTESEYHAPDFAAFLFKKAVEHGMMATRNASAEDVADGRNALRRFAADLGFLWPEDWTATVNDLAERPLKTWTAYGQEYTGLLEDDECTAMINAKLNYPLAGKTFPWTR